MLAVRKDEDRFTDLPVASFYDYLKLTNQIALYIEGPIASAFKRAFENGKLPSPTVKSLGFSKQLDAILEDVFEHTFVYVSTEATKQKQNLPGLNRADARKIPRLSPKRARGKLVPLLEENINSNSNRKMIAKIARENAKRLQDFTSQEVKRLAVTTSKALRLGLTMKQFTNQLQEAFGITRRRALNIARDQIMRMNSDITTKLAKDYGAKQFTWHHSGNKNGRPRHIARDNKTYSYKNPPTELPGVLPGCQCAMEPRW